MTSLFKLADITKNCGECKILFIQKWNDIVVQNSAMLALEKIQNSFEGEAERLVLETEKDVVKMIKVKLK